MPWPNSGGSMDSLNDFVLVRRGDSDHMVFSYGVLQYQSARRDLCEHYCLYRSYGANDAQARAMIHAAL